MAKGFFLLATEGHGVEADWVPEGKSLHLFAGEQRVLIEDLSARDMELLGEHILNCAQRKRDHEARLDAGNLLASSRPTVTDENNAAEAARVLAAPPF